jgi:hypothetical protein
MLMVPKWPDFEPDMVDDVLDGVEDMIRKYPPIVRFGIGIMLFLVELGGPVTFTGVVPLSFLSQSAGTRRLEKLSSHRFGLVRNIPKFLKIMICFKAYCRRDVERHVGADRRSWRPNRLAFRDRLVHLDESRSIPAVPTALGSDGISTPEDYLVYEGQSMGIKPVDRVSDS